MAHPFSELKIVIGEMEYPNTYADDITIDRTNLEDEFERHAERYGYWAYLAELAHDTYLRCKDELERLYALIDAEKRGIKEHFRTENTKFKYTETMVKSEVITDSRYVKKQYELRSCEHLANALKHAKESLSHRKDMLIQMGLTVRAKEPRVITDMRVSAAKEVISNSK